jgi:hypothetical protein
MIALLWLNQGGDNSLTNYRIIVRKEGMAFVNAKLIG